jgi:MerR family mercuric resistance operon transcriptional regulator
MKGLKIGELARKVKVNIETIRYYEKRGLIPQPPRKKQEFGSHPGFRLYPETTIERLQFIHRAKELGFTLKAIRRLLSIADGQESACKEVADFAKEKISEIESKIRDLTQMQEMLKKLQTLCMLNKNLSDCPIIESLKSTL